MCLICVELSKDRLTKDIFVNNYLELLMTDPEHAEEVFDLWNEKVASEDLFELD